MTFFLAGISGVLLSTSYIPFYPWALFFCLVPIFSAWTMESRPWRVFLLGWFCQFIFNIIGFHWIYHTAREFGHLPPIVSAIAVVGFASFASLDLPISGLIVSLMKRKWKFKPIYEVTLYAVTFFIVQSLYPTIFPWNLGYPWYWGHWPAIQWADVIGFEGLSLLTLLAQVVFWQMWKSRRNPRAVVRLAIFFLAVFVPFNLLGYQRGKNFETYLSEADGKDVSVLLIQANIGNLEKAFAERGEGYQDYIVQEHLSLTREALEQYPNADLIAFPETALPISLNLEYDFTKESQLVKNFIKETKKTFIVGSYTDSFPRRNPFNSVYLFGDNGEQLDFYNKTQLLAFGEYIPFGDWFPILYQWMPFISHFERGPGPTVLGWNEVKFGIQICYEGLYPRFSAGLVGKGANVIFNATNDSWFGVNFEPVQHLYMTAARSLEFRVPMIRSTNTGISTVVSQTGKMPEMSPLHQKWYAQSKLRVLNNAEPTLYAHFYFVVFLTAVLIFTLCLILGRTRVVETSAP